MAFPTGSKSSLVTIDNTKVSGSANHSDFPVLILDSNIPSSVYASFKGSQYSLDLESSSSQYAKITDGSQTGLDITGDITIELWTKWESLPSSNSPTWLVGRYNGTISASSYQFYIYNNAGTPQIRIIICSGSNIDVLSKNYTPPTGEWIHLAVTWDASTSTAEFYVNGSSIGTAIGTYTSNNNATADFNIGAGDSSPNGYFDGKMANLRIWDDVRTQSEIADNRYNLNLTPGSNNLIDVWKLDNDYVSESGNNNLTASGSPTFSQGDVPIPFLAPDIRFTSDKAGTTELAFEIVAMDTISETGEIWVKIPIVDYNDDTLIYMWYGDASLSAYAATDTYGSQAVWTDYSAVYHMDNGNDSAPTPLNATATNVTFGTTQTKTTNSGSFNGSSSTFLSATRPFNLPASLTIYGWVYFNATSQLAGIFGMGGSAGGYGYKLKQRAIASEVAGTQLFITMPAIANFNTGYTITSTGWHHVVMVRTSSTWKVRINKVDGVNTTTAVPQTPTQSMHIGADYESGASRHYLNAHIDEVKFIDSALSDDWLDTEYNNQMFPGTFLTVSEPISSGNTSGMFLSM